jgi:hypothetical protein
MGPDCLIQITVNATRSFTEKSPRDVVYIGQDLFDNYYVVLDYDNKKIGLAGYTTDVYVPEDPKSFPVWAIVLIVVAGLALIGGITFYLLRKKR